jgi:hypothetical protein
VGVPQGSILGPILFLIYINNLPNITILKTYLFADDTTLYFSHKDQHELVQTVNLELKKVVDYFRFSKIALHPLKTKFLLFTNSNTVRNSNITISLDFNNQNENLMSNIVNLTPIKDEDDVPAVRFLGVYFDSRLNFKYHVNLVANKLSKALYILRTVKNIMTPRALKMLYYSLFHCNLIYCLPAWSSANQTLLTRIFRLQKAAIRIINNVKYNEHTEPLFKSKSILPFPKLIQFFNIQFMQNFIHGHLPSSFSNLWSTAKERRISAFVLRNGNFLDIPFTRLSSSESQPWVKLPKTWEEFSEEDIKIISDKIVFKFRLKEHLLSLIPSSPNCTRLFCPSCMRNNLSL